MSKSTQGQLHNSWHNFSKYRPLIRELVTRDLKVKYRRSVLGYMWSILNPLLMMLLQTLVFSYMFRFDIPNFPLYLICGNTLFNFFNESTNMGMGSVLGNASLIKKVYVPKFIFPISRVVSSFVNLLFSLAAILLVVVVLWVCSFNQLMLASVHPALADSRGIRVFWQESLFAAAIAVVVTVSMTWVGLLVINSLLVLPAAAGRNLARNLRQYHLFSVVGALAAGIAGLLTSYQVGASTGACITLYLAIYFALTFCFRTRRM